MTKRINLTFIRDADGLTADRVRAWLQVLLVMTLAGFAIWIFSARNAIDISGKPIGSDFMSFYAAGNLALHDQAVAAWNLPRHQAAQDAIFGQRLGYWAFFYPPPFLLICLPFALVPYGWAVCLWLTSTTAAAIITLKRWASTFADTHRLGVLPFLAFPALWINIGNGQNAGLTTAIMTGGFMCLNRRPLLAGAIWGLLVIKPQMGLALPFILAAAGRWKAFAATGVSAIIYGLITTAILGSDSWGAFMDASSLARQTLEEGLVGHGKMQSLFAMARHWGLPSVGAYGFQLTGAITAITIVVMAIRKHRPTAAALAALTGAATPLLSPFLLDYDLLILALPLIWIAGEGIRTGFLPWEKAALLCGFVLPLIARTVATHLYLPISPVVIMGLLFIVMRRLERYPYGPSVSEKHTAGGASFHEPLESSNRQAK
ncbi:glycosyltransferase family 87 protein [Asticcacaulis endophyticus]|uniref:DUF2029 domain-containing protein n=1 Tax=Asticcacaulis endophyticus TaxID=1395890 RepID=A0A918Q1J6_9CAUL|nr:glycosyltransferase family 87 protein [Asticcacaulis endophyticus]GGZ28204.1 hypothetical protein GCM10011273_12480 [Asticcacaulis endophyticus]